MLERINVPEDIRKLNIEEKKILAEDIRREIIKTVSITGGHLASNLGVVELTIALHSVFQTPEDKIVWDVGHQSYVHKILTGRKQQMNTLRQFGGLAGFPKTIESVYDTFDTGHSSTSISVALGMARARDLLGKKNKVIAVIGDGALTGGMAQEALNDAGCSKTNLVVVLNDNEMSISKNVGGVPMFLSKLRAKKLYTASNKRIKTITQKIPYIGSGIITGIRKIKYGIKQLIIPNMYFEDIGFTYLGPVDGHNIEQVENLLKISKELSGPILLHVITKKGKGYLPAEKNPDKFHGTSSFNIKTGEKLKPSTTDYSKVFGEKLVQLAQKDKKIVAVTAAMKDGTGLSNFAKKYPKRFFDVGIAEQHAVGLIAGMAKEGLKPVLALYSSFLQRAYDQVIHDICIQKLPIVIGVDRAGIVGNDGETHQGIFDLSFLDTIPNLTIMAPKDFKELEDMLEFAIELKQPVCLRYPRGGEVYAFEQQEKLELGKAEIVQEGRDITIVAIGNMVARALKVAEILKEKGVSIEIINARFMKPLDEETILTSVRKTKKVVTIEDNLRIGGLGEKIANLMVEKECAYIPLRIIGYPDEFIKHGEVKQIEKQYGLDVETIAKIVTTIV